MTDEIITQMRSADSDKDRTTALKAGIRDRTEDLPIGFAGEALRTYTSDEQRLEALCFLLVCGKLARGYLSTDEIIRVVTAFETDDRRLDAFESVLTKGFKYPSLMDTSFILTLVTPSGVPRAQKIMGIQWDSEDD